MNLEPVTYKVLYNQRNITKDVSDYLLSLTYSDKVAGETDEVELTLHDKDGLWQNDWHPGKGDLLYVEIEDAGKVLNCGSFTIDETELSIDRSGDIFSIRAIAAAITKKLRTKKSSAHEKKTLRELAVTIAAQHGFTVQGTIANIRIDRVTQHHKSDLKFLMTIANDYGYTFSVRDKLLIFTDIYSLEKSGHVLSLDKTDLISGSFKDVAEGTATKAVVKHHNPQTNELVESEIDNEDTDLYSTAEDTVIVHQKAENKQQAELIGKAALHKANTPSKSCSITCPGNVLIVSGVNIEITGVGKHSGIYHITDSTHSLDRSGYVTSFEAKKVKLVPPTKYHPKKTANKPVPRSIGTLAGSIIAKNFAD